MIKKLLIVSIVLMAGVLYYAYSIIHEGDVPAPAAPVAVAAHPALNKSPEMQAERQELIKEAVRLELFTKVVRKGTGLPRAWTGRTFETVDFDTKVGAISVVYAYYFDGTDPRNLVVIVDGKTGHDIGRFSLDGLSME